MMISRWTLIWLFAAALASVFLFHTSQDVQHQHAKLAEIEADITKETEAIRVLNAEWNYLNQPERIERLVAEHLPRLRPTKGQQMAPLNEVLFDPPPVVTAQKPAPVAAVKPEPRTAAPVVAIPAPTIRAAAPERSFGDLIQSLGAR